MEGRQIGGEQRVWPMHGSLPMGFSWSMYFAQRANVTRLARQPSLQGAVQLTDRGPPLVMDGSGDSTGYYMYVDNAGVLSTSGARASSAISEAQLDFETDRLLFHEVEFFNDVGKALGCEIDVQQHKARPTSERFASARQAVRFALRQRRLAGWQVEMMMGHSTFLAIARRAALAIVHATNRFM